MSKLDQLKALGDAKRAARNRSDGGPNAHQVPKGTVRESKPAGKPAARVATSPSGVIAARINGLQTVGTTASVRDGVSKRGRGRPKVEGPRPWETAGISKTSYYRYRRQAEKK